MLAAFLGVKNIKKLPNIFKFARFEVSGVFSVALRFSVRAIRALAIVPHKLVFSAVSARLSVFFAINIAYMRFSVFSFAYRR